MKSTDNKGKDNGQEETISDATEVSMEDLLKQLNILNISFDALLIIMFAIYLNLEYIHGEKVKVLDQLNNTNISDTLPDLSKIPRISNELFLFTTSIFLFINYDSYVSAVESDDTEREQNRAFRAFISTFLVLVSTSITSGNLEV